MKCLNLLLLTLTLTLISCANGRENAPYKKAEFKGPNPDVATKNPTNPANQEQEEMIFELHEQWNPEYTEIFLQYFEADPEILELITPDIINVCPNYERFNLDRQKQYLIYFFHALAIVESDLNQYNVTREPMLGKDKVTGKHLFSEGLFQLSYQDAVIHKCNFNWGSDKHLDSHHPEKTIFNPRNQITCALKIFKTQLIKTKQIFAKRPFYWAPLTSKEKKKPFKALKNILNQAAPCF